MRRSLKIAVLDSPSVMAAKVMGPRFAWPDQTLGGTMGPLQASMMPGPPRLLA